jgi:hypothetical protein
MNRIGIVTFKEMKDLISGHTKKNSRQNSPLKKNTDVTMDVQDVLGRRQKSSNSTSSSDSVTKSAKSKLSKDKLTNRRGRESVVVPLENFFTNTKNKFYGQTKSTFDSAPRNINQIGSNTNNLSVTSKEQKKKVNFRPEVNEDVSNDGDNISQTKNLESNRSADGTSSESSSPVSTSKNKRDSKSNSAEENGASPSIGLIKSRSQSAFNALKTHTPDFQQLKRNLSKKISSLKLPQIIDPHKTVTPLNTPRNSNGEAHLLKVPAAVRFNIAQEISALRKSVEYNNATEERKKIIVGSKIMEHLINQKIGFDQELLNALTNDAENYTIKTVDLSDEKYVEHITQAAKSAFETPWTNEKVGNESKYSDLVTQDEIRATFARDFDCSNYFIIQADGRSKKIDSIDEYLSFTRNNAAKDMPKIVSNIASQNFGIFLKNAVFNRKTKDYAQYEFDSALALPNGVQVYPSSSRGVDDVVNYKFEKKTDGSLIINYERTMRSSAENPVRASSLGLDAKTVTLRDDAVLSYCVPITIEANGEWTIGNIEIETYQFKPAP